jgi:hypothetical protein
MNFVATAASTPLVFSTFEQGSELGLDYVTIAVAVPPVLTPSLPSYQFANRHPVATGAALQC